MKPRISELALTKTIAVPACWCATIIPDSPADREQSKLQSGDVILSIDSKPVDPGMDLTTVLNGPIDRDILLHVQRTKAGDEGKEEKVELGRHAASDRFRHRPIAAVRSLARAQSTIG